MKNTRRIAGLVLLILLASTIQWPQGQAITPQQQTISITDTHDDLFITETGIGIDSQLCHITDPNMDIRSFLVFRELDINFWEPLTNATLRFRTTSTLDFDADSSVTVYGMRYSDLQREGWLNPGWVLTVPFTSAYTNYNTSQFSGQTWHEMDVTSIVEELIRSYDWDGDGHAGTETGDAIGFIIVGAEGHDTRWFIDYLYGTPSLAPQLVIHWNHEVPPPVDPPEGDDPVFIEQYGNYTIWGLPGGEGFDDFPGWTYRQNHTIEGSEAGAQTNYQIKIEKETFLTIPSNAVTNQTTPTSDGSGQVVHPSILYFSDAWNDYKYWMVMNPFTDGDDDVETPEILASNDGSSWVVPAGLTNPIVARDAGAPNADPCLFYNEATDELWVYYMKTDLGTYSRIYLKKSNNGTYWGGSGLGTLVLDEAFRTVHSPSVVKVGITYHIWTVDTIASPNEIEHRVSTDGESWSSAETCNIHGDMPSGFMPWHIGSRWMTEYSELWMPLTLTNADLGWGTANWLMFAKSQNGTDWYLYPTVLLEPSGAGWDNKRIYKTTFIQNGSTLKIWYSGTNVASEWYVGYTTATIDTDVIDMLSKMRTDGGDVRFTEDDGSTELYYWIQEFEYGGDAVFWVNVSNIPSSPNNATIYFYYGNPSATTTSSIRDTMIVGDDFNSVDLVYWTKKKCEDVDAWGAWLPSSSEEMVSDDTTLQVVDGWIDVNSWGSNENTWWGILIKKTGLSLLNVSGGIKTRFTGTVSGQGKLGFGFLNSSGATKQVTMDKVDHQIDSVKAHLQAGDIASQEMIYNIDEGAGEHTHIWEIRRGDSQNVSYVSDDVDLGNYSNSDTFDTFEVYWLSYVANDKLSMMKVDFVYIRKYVLDEPTLGDLGDEEVGDYTYFVVDANGTVLVDDLDSLDDAEDWIDTYDTDPEDPDPPGWPETGGFTRFRMRLYFLVLGLGCLFGPILFFASGRGTGYYLMCGFIIMLFGIGLLMSIGQV